VYFRCLFHCATSPAFFFQRSYAQSTTCQSFSVFLSPTVLPLPNRLPSLAPYRSHGLVYEVTVQSHGLVYESYESHCGLVYESHESRTGGWSCGRTDWVAGVTVRVRMCKVTCFKSDWCTGRCTSRPPDLQTLAGSLAYGQLAYGQLACRTRLTGSLSNWLASVTFSSCRG
jgi:hypothetical protein